MKHDQHTADEQERQMLEHFRQYSDGEPSAQLDAQILAAASAAARNKTAVDAKPSVSERLHCWLFGVGGRQRWSLALAGVACLGIGVSLTWRTLEQIPDSFDGVPGGALMTSNTAKMAAHSAPQIESTAVADEAQHSRSAQSAPVIQGYSADKAKVEKKLAAGAASQSQGNVQAVEALNELLPQAARAPAQRALAKAAEPAVSQAEQHLHNELQRLLSLRRDGWTDEADALLLQLMREHPELDIDAQLQQLQPPD
tara:strand:- start:2086 stop:2850 length:765 start_codon:yes stop_codon:yes gene_type:complete